MEFLNQLVLQFKSIYSKMSRSQKLSFVLVIASIATCLIIVFMWSSKPDYVVLYADLTTDDAAKIHTKLNELKVPYKVVGTTIEVPSRFVYETRLQLADEGLPKGSYVGYEIFDKTTMGQTDYLQRLNFQRALEGELSRTISSLDAVEFARVHLVIPKSTIFSEKEERVSASVIITPQRGATLPQKNVLAITHLVASSVEGLETSDVTIIDSNGNLLSSMIEDNIAVSLTSSQLDVQQNIERYLENKISTLLTGVLGPGRAIVRVNAEVDFSQMEKTQERFDPESQVARSENRIEESNTNTEGEGSSVEKTISNYEIDKTVEHIIGATGSIERLSLAVVVDGTYKVEGEGKDKERVYAPRSSEEQESIKKLVISSIGINEKRGDTIEVINIPFDQTYVEEQRRQMEEMKKAEFFRAIATQWPWLIVFLIFGVLVLILQKVITQASVAKVAIGQGAGRYAGSRGRSFDSQRAGEELYGKMREEESEEQRQAQTEMEAERKLIERMEEEVVSIALQNPDAVAKVVEEWLDKG